MRFHTEADFAAFQRQRAQVTRGQLEGDNIPEADFMAQVIRLAKLHGFLVYHTHDSRRSEPGFPDLVLVNRTLLFVEVKSATGKLTKEQAWWLITLRNAGQEVAIWRPADMPTIAERLGKG